MKQITIILMMIPLMGIGQISNNKELRWERAKTTTAELRPDTITQDLLNPNFLSENLCQQRGHYYQTQLLGWTTLEACFETPRLIDTETHSYIITNRCKPLSKKCMRCNDVIQNPKIDTLVVWKLHKN